MLIYQDTSANSRGNMPRKRQSHTTVAGMGRRCRRGGDLCGAEVLGSDKSQNLDVFLPGPRQMS